MIMKKILSLIMAVILTVGFYTVTPKKYNPLPTTDVAAAKNYAGAYKVMSQGRIRVMYKSFLGGKWIYGYGVYQFEPSQIGTVRTLDSEGWMKITSSQGNIYYKMIPFIDQGILQLYYH